MTDVRHNPEESRYEILVDGNVVGHAAYTVDGDTLTASSTEVDPAHGGKGYAGQMVEQLLQDAREAGRQVLPTCSYVAGYIGKNPEHIDLVPEERRSQFGL